MFKNTFTKTLYEKHWTIMGWTVGIVAMAMLTMSIYPSFNKQGIDEVIGSVPDSLKALVGSVDSYRSIPGFVAQQIFGPQLPIFTIILAIMLYYGISVGDEDRGTLQTLLAQPVTRRTVFFQKFWAGVVLIVIASLAITVGTLIGINIIHESISMVRLFEATFMCGLMTLAYGSVAFAFGMGTGKKALTIAVASGYAIVSFFISSLAPSVKVLQPFDKLSVFHYYNNPQTMVTGIHWINALIIAAVIVVLIGTSSVLFANRDITHD